MRKEVDRMDAGIANEILTAVSTVGFPIVCCGYLFYANKKQQDLHYEEMKELSGAIQSLSNTLSGLKELIEHGKGA